MSEILENVINAIKIGDTKEFLRFAKQVDFNETLPDGRTALLTLLDKSNWNETSDFMLQYMIQNELNLDKSDNRGFTALGYMISDRKFEQTEKLLDFGAHVNVPAIIRIIPHARAFDAYVASQGQQPYPAAHWRQISPLCIAIYKREEDLAVKMVEKGADVNFIGELDITPLSMAIRMEMADMQAFLLQKGANPNIVPQNWRKYAHKEELVCPVALKKALKYGNAAALDLLIQADVRVPDLFPRQNKQFSSPLTYMLSQEIKQLKNDRKSVKILINAGVNPNLVDSDGRNALSYAAEKGNQSVIPFILTDENKNKMDKNAKTPAIYAYEGRHFDVLDLLFQAGVSLDQTSQKTGQNLLMRALDQGDGEMVSFLLNRRPNLLRCDKKGRSILDYAPQKGVLAQKIHSLYQQQYKMINPAGRAY